MNRPKALVLGGKPFNLPAELRRLIDVERHIVQADLKHWCPPSISGKYDMVLVIAEFSIPRVVEEIKRRVHVPVIHLQRGWGRMREELIRHGFLTNEVDLSTPKPHASIPPIPQSPPKEAPPPPTVTGLPPEELWRLYGQNVIATIRAVIKPGERIPEKEMTETIALLVGIPTQDILTILPELAMRGLLQPSGEGFWVRTPNMANDEEMEKAQQRERCRTRKISITGSTATEAKLLRGLPMGPYLTKTSIYELMRRYMEFASLSFTTIRRRFDSALKMGIIEENHDRYYIDHDPSVRLTLVQEGVARGL